MKENKSQDNLDRIKKNIRNAFEYFKDNYTIYHESRRLIFISTLNNRQRSILKALRKPPLEFNLLEPYISKQLGEFASQEPSPMVTPKSGKKVDPLVIEKVEGHSRSILDEYIDSGDGYELYRDLLTGGFGVLEVGTEYENGVSLDQCIKIKRSKDPTMIGFDPVAETRSKTDGRYCVKLIPLTKEDAKKYGIKVDDVSFYRSASLSGFNWSYKNQNEDILLYAIYYEKVEKKKDVVRLSNNKTILFDDYKNLVDKWNYENNPEIPPTVIEGPIEKDIVTIEKYTLIESEILTHEETVLEGLPYIFADGNSVSGKDNKDGIFKQEVRPYIKNAIGAQRLHDYTGQTLAHEFESMVKNKYKLSLQSFTELPAPYQDVYRDSNSAEPLLYNEFKSGDPNVRLTPPMEVGRVPPPRELIETFMAGPNNIQHSLGSYDAQIGINNNQLSGVAIDNAAVQNNAVAIPYRKGYDLALTEALREAVELMPKVHTMARSIPVKTITGEKEFITINDPELGGISFDYEPGTFDVRVRSGTNFEAQKSRSLNTMIALANALPIMQEFFNDDPKVVKILMDNVGDIRGAEKLKILAEDFALRREEAKKQEQLSRQNQPQIDPTIAAIQVEHEKINSQQKIEQEKLSLKAAENETNAAIKSSEVEVDIYKAETDRMKLALDAAKANEKHLVDLDRHTINKIEKMTELGIKSADLMHRHKKDMVNHIKSEDVEKNTEESPVDATIIKETSPVS